MPTTHVYADFNGDGRSDFLTFEDRPLFTPPPLPHPDGTVESVKQFLSNVNGSFTESINALQFHISFIYLSYNAIIATGDFNGDGYADILAGNVFGSYTVFDGSSSGKWGFPGTTIGSVDTSWQIVGVGDFNGDGRSDILWRDGMTGQVTDWLATANGGFTHNSSNFSETVPTNWRVVGTGDFNGDGRSDILWRDSNTGQITDWLATANGGFTHNSSNFSQTVATNWAVVGTGDFNGDGHTDILWRDSNTGQITDWLATANGGFTQNSSNFSETVPTSWQVSEVGDFNGDGRSDILWSNGSSITEFLANVHGGFTSNPAVDIALATNEHVVHLL